MSENSVNGPIMIFGLLYGNGGYEETCKIIGLAGLYLVYPTSWAVTAIGLLTVGLIVWRKKVVPDMRENRMTADVSACK